MQNKGLIKFFTIVFALVCIYQLTFTFVTNKIEKDAKNYANGDFAKETKYLDSLSKIPVYLGMNYHEVRDKQLNKGLDLEGGINVLLQISVKDIIKGLSNNSQNEVFNKALAEATTNQKGNQTYTDAFLEAFDRLSNGTVKLSDPTIFSNKNLEGTVNFKMSDSEVKPILKRKINESVVSAFEVLRKRIDQFGVTQPNIQMIGESGRILVELPGAKDVDRIKKLLQTSAQLEFWETYKMDEMGQFLMAANEALKKTEKAVAEVKTETKSAGIDSLLTNKTSKDSVAQAKGGNNPLIDKLVLDAPPGNHILVAQAKYKDQVMAYLNRADIRALLPADKQFVKFAWGKPEKEDAEAYELYALKGNQQNKAPLAGGVIVEAMDSFDQFGKPSVSMQMNGAGSREWEKITEAVSRQGNGIAIVLDDVVYSAPGVSKGKISGGRSEISGNFTINETKDLANVLRAGKLPAKADIVQSELVGPSLGQEAIDAGMMSFAIGFLLVLVWMVLYYGKAGWYANIALLVNVLFIFGILASFGAVLTLPGIAGIVLTMGMAVDANVIIYERAKEELAIGKTLDQAVAYAYTWRGAMSSIVDANVTTAITALILYVLGTGPIKGFAITLLIGIATTMITALFVARLFIDWSINKNDKMTFSTKITENWFKNLHFDFMKYKKIAYIFSGILVLISVASMFTKGLNQGIDFVGGRTFQVRFENSVKANEVSADLSKEFGSAVEAKVFGKDNQLKITTKYRVNEEGENVDKEVNQKLFEGLQKYLPKDFSYEKFVVVDEGKTIGLLQASKVTPTISNDIKTSSIWAVLASLAVVFLYLMISFRKWQFSLGAVVAVAHDTIIVLGVFSLFYNILPFNMEIDQAFIAAILTVIGYSLNDTVIVFDRVRDYLRDRKAGEHLNDTINGALNTTLTRTINTSLTTLVVLVAILFFGGETIRGFVFAIFVGILVGTYSSWFIATPILRDTLSKTDELNENKK